MTGDRERTVPEGGEDCRLACHHGHVSLRRGLEGMAWLALNRLRAENIMQRRDTKKRWTWLCFRDIVPCTATKQNVDVVHVVFLGDVAWSRTEALHLPVRSRCYLC